ncbi:MAG: hypothetical protein R6T96_07935 [Longimicrobiales bacterium]
MNRSRKCPALLLPAVLFLLSRFVFPSSIQAQEPTVDPAPEAGAEVVRLFLDCKALGCFDDDFFRTEIQFVNWVRDREDSDIHLLVTAQTTGSGGQAHHLFFMGRGRFQGMADTLKYVSAFDATPDETRRGLAAIIKIGLMRYVGLTPLAKDIAISLKTADRLEGGREAGGQGVMATSEDDPWDFWTFRARLSTNLRGESTYKSSSLTGSLTASRTTEEWKASLYLSSRYSEQKFDYDDYETLSVTRSHSFSGLLVKSIDDHWSLGLRGGASSSTYSNIRLAVNAAPVLEYNIFPYSESTRRLFTFQYALESSYFQYEEETVYFKEEEGLLSHRISGALSLTQPWGSAGIFSEVGHYLRDIDQHHASIGGSLSIRLARGFSFSVHGSVERIQDRISVPLRSASVEDILLQRRQLQTDYSYYTYFSLNYTFGSVFNNVVNPRFGGGSGGMIIF